jgi:hypothetical protein
MGQIARDRAGPHSAESHSRGELVSAPDGHLQRRSATLPCGTIAIQAGALGQDVFQENIGSPVLVLPQRPVFSFCMYVSMYLCMYVCMYVFIL